MIAFQRALYVASVVVIAGLGCIGSMIMFFAMTVSHFVPWEQPCGRGWFLIPAATGLICMVLAIVGFFRPRDWKFAGFFSLLPLAMLTFLGWDSAPAKEADLGPRTGDDDPFYRTVMWLSEKSPHSRLAQAPDLTTDASFKLPDDQARWLDDVKAHREEISAAWRDLKHGREWIDALRTTPARGTWPQGVDTPYLAFRAVRKISYTVQAYALLRASEGAIDEAIDVQCDLLEANAKMQEAGAGLLNQTIHVVVMKAGVRTLEVILKQGPASSARQDRLRALLERMPRPERILHLAFEGEVEFSGTVVDATRHGEGRILWTGSKAEALMNFSLRYFGRYLFNENRTKGLINESLREWERIGRARRLDELKDTLPHADSGLQRCRNPAGRLLVAMLLPAFNKVVTNVWDAEDLRIALREKIENS